MKCTSHPGVSNHDYNKDNKIWERSIINNDTGSFDVDLSKANGEAEGEEEAKHIHGADALEHIVNELLDRSVDKR